MVIATERLRLRAHRPADLAELVALLGDPLVVRWLGAVPDPYRHADGRRWIAHVRREHRSGRPLSFAIALAGSDRLIGGVGLDGGSGDGSPEPSLGYWVGRSYWGHGYGREAVAAVVDYGLRVLGLETIRAYTDPRNRRSQRLLRRCGLAYAGEIELLEPTRSGARRAPLYRIARRDHQ